MEPNPSALRGTIAQILSVAMWASDFAGHPAVGTILNNPQVATALTTFIAAGFTLWGIGEHLLAAVTAKAAKSALGIAQMQMSQRG